MKRNVKMIFFIFAGILISFNCFIEFSYGDSEKIVNIEDMIDIGIKNSKEIRELELTLLEKEIEEKRFNERIKKARDFDKSVNILDQPELIQNLLDLNSIQTELESIKKSSNLAKLRITKEIRIKYLELAYQDYLVKKIRTKYEQAENTRETLKMKFKTGQISGDTFLLEEDKINAMKDELDRALLDYENILNSFSRLTGETFSEETSFKLEFTTIDLENLSIEDLIEQVYLNDENINLTLARKYENALEIEILIADEKKQQGSIFQEIHNEIESGDIELNDIVDAYDDLYKNVETDKILYRFVPINNFVIALDKSSLKDYSHFNNEKYATSLAFVEKEKLSNEYDKRKLELTEIIEGTILNIKKNMKSFEQLKSDYDKARLKYDEYLLDMKKGIIKYEQLIEVQEMKDDIYQNLIKSMVDINRLLFNLSYDSRGWLEDYIWCKKISNEQLLLGEEFTLNKKEVLENTKKDTLDEWNVKRNIATGEMKFSILNIPDDIEITDYSLRTYENIKLSPIIPINASFLRMPSILEDFQTGYIYVDFYSKEKQVSSAIIDGFSNGGKFINYKKMVE